MKTIQFTTSVAGARFDYHTDEEVTLDDKAADEFVRNGQAVEIKAPSVFRRRRGNTTVETTAGTGAPESR